MENLAWRQKAEVLFFVEKKGIGEIGKILNISRKSISIYLKSVEGFLKEKERRKKENKIKRKECKKEWDKVHRANRYREINGQTLRMEHDLAGRILSIERNF